MSNAPPSAAGLPKIVLNSRTNSHPFQERVVLLSPEPHKIGRSVGRTKPAVNNLIFDCKVLSRNHALMWYDQGQFWVQDTKSSNGTFVNNQRLNRANTEESPPREVYYGDIIQFGVDVVENQRNGITHGCIIGNLMLYHPDGSEAKPTQTNNGSNAISLCSGMPIPSADLYQLQQYLEEAAHREQMLETKLATIQRLLDQTQDSSNNSWKALIEEDRMVTRLQMLEEQLSVFAANTSPESLQQEVTLLHQEKVQLTEFAKQRVEDAVKDKHAMQAKLDEAERLCRNADEECDYLRASAESCRAELAKVVEEYEATRAQLAEAKQALADADALAKRVAEQADTEKAQHLEALDGLKQEHEAMQQRIAKFEKPPSDGISFLESEDEKPQNVNQLGAELNERAIDVPSDLGASARPLSPVPPTARQDEGPSSHGDGDHLLEEEEFPMGDDLTEFPIDSIFNTNAILLEALHSDFAEYASCLDDIGTRLATDTRGELDALREKMARSLECIDQLKEGFDTNSHTIQELRDELDRSRHALGAREAALESAARNLDSRDVELVALQEQLVDARSSIGQLRGVVSDLTTQLEEANNARHQAELGRQADKPVVETMTAEEAPKVPANSPEVVSPGLASSQMPAWASEPVLADVQPDAQSFTRAPVKIIDKLKRSEAERDRLQTELAYLQSQIGSESVHMRDILSSMDTVLKQPQGEGKLGQLFTNLCDVSTNLQTLQSRHQIVSSSHAELYQRATSDSIALLNTLPLSVIILAIVCALFKALFPDT